MDGAISGFEWDLGNLGHCRKHGVSRAEIESIFASPVLILPDAGHSQTERRFRAIGRTGRGRAVFLVFAVREQEGRRVIRPVTARYMHQEEIDKYDEAYPQL